MLPTSAIFFFPSPTFSSKEPKDVEQLFIYFSPTIFTQIFSKEPKLRFFFFKKRFLSSRTPSAELHRLLLDRV